MDLTPRQQQILQLIRARIDEAGMPPTRAEIAQALGFRSVNAAEQHLHALARKGAIELIKGASRGIRLVHTPPAGLPVVGRVAAGHPILAQEHVEHHYELPAGLFRPAAHYLLRVQGESMRDAGILDGDLLAVHATPQAENGRIVVARLGDEVTVKRLQRIDEARVRLLPANPDFAPIEIDLRVRQLVIEGIGVGLLRDRMAERL